MTKQIFWSPLALQDFDIILNYLQAHWEEKILEKFIDIVDESLDQIATHPKQYPLLNLEKNIRKCVLTKHNTIYSRENNLTIDILRIFDNRQDPEKLTF